MNPRVSIPRSAANPCKDAEAPAPSWWPVNDPTDPGRVVALVKCARGHASSLSEHVHRVERDGCVSPSFVCPYGCTWHVFIRLGGLPAPGGE